MSWVILGALAMISLLLLGSGLTRVNAASLVSGFRVIAAVVVCGAAIVLAATGRWTFAVPLGLFGLSLFGFGFGWAKRGSGLPPPPTGHKRSTVSTGVLEVELDHISGDIRGRVVSGRFAGQDLDDLEFDDLVELWGSVGRKDRESLSLLEAYLDRREPGWREDVERDGRARQAGPAGAGTMSEEEAYKTLGLRPGASEADIRAAHRSLMKRVHPDLGGSDHLAAKINEAKERLLGGHRKR